MPTGGNFDCGSGSGAACEPIATTGLCLADGTPIAVVATRDCDTGVVAAEGWLNLTNGAYSAGDPPAGTVACGESRSIQVSGVFCDVLPDGTVAGLVLVEYSYAADGSISSVRLVDATTGATYTPQGEITTCPAAAEVQLDREPVVLCYGPPPGAQGGETTFLRHFTYAEDGSLTYVDTNLAGAPITIPAGNLVFRCYNVDTEVYPMCVVDADGNVVRRVLAVTRHRTDLGGHISTTYSDPVTGDGAPPLQAGESYAVCPEPCRNTSTLLLCDTTEFATQTVFNPAGVANADGWSLTSYTVVPAACAPQNGPDTPPPSPAVYIPSSGFGAPSLGIRADEMFNPPGAPCPAGCDCSWRGYGAAQVQYILTKTFDAPEDGVAKVVATGFRADGGGRVRINGQDAGIYGQWNQPSSDGTVLVPVTAGVNTIQIEVHDVPFGQTWGVTGRLDLQLTKTTQILGSVITDCATGEVVSVTYTTLEGEPYTPTGEVGQCVPAGGAGECCEPCAATSTPILLCDTPPGTPTVMPGVGNLTDTDPTPYFQFEGDERHPDGGQALWDGGSLIFPAETAPAPGSDQQYHNAVAAVLTADVPGCDDGTGTVTVTANVTVENLGPTDGYIIDGLFKLVSTADGAVLDSTNPQDGAPVGYVGTLTVSATVPASQVAAGGVAVYLDLENFDSARGSKAWEARDFSTDLQFTVLSCPEPVPFLRTLTTDCAGVVVSMSDTTLDGASYTPTGEIGQCTTGGGAAPDEPCRNTSTLLLCDLPGDGEPTAAVADTDPTPYADVVAPQGNEPVDGGAAALWTGGTLTISPDTAPPPDGNNQFTRSFAATVQAARPACDTGTATVTATIRATRTGPDAGCAGTGSWSLLTGATPVQVAIDGIQVQNPPVGTVAEMTVTGQVPAADLAAGNVGLLGRLETYHRSPASCPGGSNPDGARIGGWTVDEFTITAAYDQAGCAEQVLATVVTDCDTGQVESVTYTTLDGAPYTPTGEIGQCTPAGGQVDPCQVAQVLERCKCDDVNGDGSNVVTYTELYKVDCNGQVSSIGSYTDDLEPYEPVNPVDCDAVAAPSDEIVGVQALRVQLAPGQSWTAAAEPLLQSVTATAVTGEGTVTDEAGPTTLHTGETATWSVQHDYDLTLQGPLTIAATTGTVTLNITRAVTA